MRRLYPHHWTCRRCAPLVARYFGRDRRVLGVFLLHGVECDLPVRERTTIMLRFGWHEERAA